MWGIDVSHHQGTINFRAVKQYGIQYVIMKAMYEKSHSLDERFEYNYAQAGTYGLERGVYLYMLASDIASADREANDMLRILHGRKLERGVWLDVEDPRIKGLSKQQLSDIIYREADILQSGGYNVGIYTNLDWYKNVVDGNELSKKFKWWMARYPKNDDGSLRIVLQPDKKIAMWQYSSKGIVDGIKGPVDMDYDMADLNKDNITLAKEILAGKWGNGQIRMNRLEAAGYVFSEVQRCVTELDHARKYYPKHNGPSFKLDTILEEIGVPSKYIGNKDKRLPIARANGIVDYHGSLTQNLRLIALAKAGELKRV